MDKNSFIIKYPPVHPGTDETNIRFHSGTPDLVSVFNPGKQTASGVRRIFVTDGTVATLPCMQNFISSFDDGKCGQDILLVLGSGEPYKTIESVLTIDRAALDAGFTRKDIFVGIGGGVITDTTGFAASLFKRGTAVQFVPTTLLAMVDAAIGGKTGCDFENYKNMIGSFFPAQELHIFPQFVQSLSDSQYRSGLAEAVKTALLYDKELYDIFKNNSAEILKRNPSVIDSIITKCEQAKAKVVEEDLTEKGVRMYLNFGHTFGHALETIVGLGNMTHGDAVAWGISRALALSVRKEQCRSAYQEEVMKVLSSYGWETGPIPKIVTGGGFSERLISAMHKDKKNDCSKVRVILQKELTETLVTEVDDKDIQAVLK